MHKLNRMHLDTVYLTAMRELNEPTRAHVCTPISSLAMYLGNRCRWIALKFGVYVEALWPIAKWLLCFMRGVKLHASTRHVNTKK